MGPDGSPKDPERRRPFGIDRLDRPCLATWVAYSDDLLRIASLAKAENVDLGEVLPGSRSRPDGSLLQWIMTDLTKDRESGTIPYFIDWGDSPHPAATAPKGCTLSGLRVFHPEAERITHVLWKLGIDLPVGEGAPSLEATIESPKGTVDLS